MGAERLLPIFLLLFPISFAAVLEHAPNATLLDWRFPSSFPAFYSDAQWQAKIGAYSVAGMRIYPPNAQSIIDSIGIWEMDEMAEADFSQMLSQQEAKQYAQAISHLSLAAAHRRAAVSNCTSAAALSRRAPEFLSSLPQYGFALFSIPNVGIQQGALHYLYLAALAQKASDFLDFAMHYSPYFDACASNSLLALSQAALAVNEAEAQAEDAAGSLEFSGMCASQNPPAACFGWNNFVFEAKLPCAFGSSYSCAADSLKGASSPLVFADIMQLRGLSLGEKYNQLVGRQNSMLAGMLALGRESRNALSDAQGAQLAAKQSHASLLSQAKDALERASTQQYWKIGSASEFASAQGEVVFSDALSFYDRFERSKSLVQQSSTQFSIAQSALSSNSRGYLLASIDAHAKGISQANDALYATSSLESDAAALLGAARANCSAKTQQAQMLLQLSTNASSSRLSLAAAKISNAQEALLQAGSKSAGESYLLYSRACAQAAQAISLLDGSLADNGDLQSAQNMLKAAQDDGLEVSYEQSLFSTAKTVLESQWAGEEAYSSALSLLQSIQEGTLAKEAATLAPLQEQYSQLSAFAPDSQLASRISSFNSLYVRGGKISETLALGNLRKIQGEISDMQALLEEKKESIASSFLSQNAQVEILSSDFNVMQGGTIQGRIITRSPNFNATHVSFFVPGAFEVRMLELEDSQGLLESISYNPSSSQLQLQLWEMQPNRQYSFYFEKKLEAQKVSFSSIVRSNEGSGVRIERTVKFTSPIAMQALTLCPLPSGSFIISSSMNSNPISGSIAEGENGTFFAAFAQLLRGENSLLVHYNIENAFIQSSSFSSSSFGPKVSVLHVLNVSGAKDSLNGTRLSFDAPFGISDFSVQQARKGTLASSSYFQGGYSLVLSDVKEGDFAQFFISYSIDNSSYVHDFLAEREQTAAALGDLGAQQELLAARSKLEAGDAAGALSLASKVVFATPQMQEDYSSRIWAINSTLLSMEQSLSLLMQTPFWKENSLAGKISQARILLSNAQLEAPSRISKANAALLDAAGDISSLQQRLEKEAQKYPSYTSGQQATALLLSARTSLLFGDSSLALAQCVQAAQLLSGAQEEQEEHFAQEKLNASALLSASSAKQGKIDSLFGAYSSEYEDAKAAKLGSAFAKTPSEIKSELAALDKQLSSWAAKDGSLGELQGMLAAKDGIYSYMQDSLHRIAQQSNSSLSIASAAVGEFSKSQPGSANPRLAQLSSALSSATLLHQQEKYSQSISASSQIAKSAAAAMGQLPAQEDQTGMLVAALSFIFAALAATYLVFAARKKGGEGGARKTLAPAQSESQAAQPPASQNGAGAAGAHF